MAKSKVEVRPITGHEGPEMESENFKVLWRVVVEGKRNFQSHVAHGIGAKAKFSKT